MPETTETTAVVKETTDDKAVPYERFRKVNESKRDLETQLAQAKQALEERESQDLGEADKLRRELEKAEARAAENEARAAEAAKRATTLERAGWVRSTAARVGFADPEDAVIAFEAGRLGDIDDQAKVEPSLKSYLEQRSHLAAKNPDEAATPGLAKILEGQANGAPQADPKRSQAEAEAQMIAENLKQFVRR